MTVTGTLDEDDYWTALAAPDLALLPYRVVTQSGTFNSCASRKLPVLASDASYFTRIQSKWGTPETVDVTDTDAVVERVRTLLEDTVRRRDLADAMRQYRRTNSFEQVGIDHLRIYHHLENASIEELADTGTLNTSRAESEPAPEIESSARLRAPCSAQRTVTTD